MADERDVAQWTWPQWAGTLQQLQAAAALARPKLQTFAAFPEPYDSDHPWDPSKEQNPIQPRYARYLEAVSVRKVEVVVEERDGYTHHAQTLDYLTQISEQDASEIEKIFITLGKGLLPPGVELRVSNSGLAVKIVGVERTWTAGLRHELERVLRPPWRLRAPLPVFRDLLIAAVTAFVMVGVALGAILTAGSPWSEGTRIIVSIAAGALGALAVTGVSWASAETFELLAPGSLPRYQRWRKRVYAVVTAVVVGIAASALYGLLS
jgi:hypothetical protein